MVFLAEYIKTFGGKKASEICWPIWILLPTFISILIEEKISCFSNDDGESQRLRRKHGSKNSIASSEEFNI